MNKLFDNVQHPNNEMFNKLSNIISGRMTIQQALPEVRPFATTNVVVLNAVDEWLKEVGNYQHYSYGSRMKQTFHQAPSFAYASSKQVQETIAWLNKKLKIKLSVKADIKSAQDALELLETKCLLMELIGATGVARFIRTTGKRTIPEQKKRSSRKFRLRYLKMSATFAKLNKRQTCRAQLKLICASVTATYKSLERWKKVYFGDYKRALKFVSTFVGRVHTWFNAWMRAQAGITAKVGLVNIVLQKYDVDLRNYPLTMIFLALASSEFSKRKEFTLESQKQGGLNSHLRAIFDEIVANERGGLKYIAFIVPAIEVWQHVDVTFLRAIRFEWMQWMKLQAIVLEEQWLKGVQKSSRRSMRVLPGEHRRYKNGTFETIKRSGVNSILWNAVADSWNSAASFMRGTDIILHEQPTFWGKTLQLIANDQYMWGQYEGKKMHSDVELFRSITKEMLPWHICHPDYSDEFDGTYALQVFFKNVADLKITKVDSWLTIPVLRKADVTSHHDMICGCAVPPMSQELYDYFASSTGVFGATGWDGN